MTRMTFFALAAVAMIGTACERHPAEELVGEHGGPAAAHSDVPRNPAGSGPTATEEKHAATTTIQKPEEKETAPAPAGATPAPKGSSFFPSNK